MSFYITLKPDYARNSGMRSSCSPPGAPPGGPSSVGLPIQIATGNVWFDQTDAMVPGAGAALVLGRSYNSLNAFQNLGGIFGRGWHHPYERKIDVVAGTTRALALVGPDGVPLYFQDNDDANDVYKPFAPITDQSTIQKQPDANPVRFIRQFRAGGSEEYDASGRLTALVDPFGKRTVLAYASGLLTTITDQSSGRSLTLGYTGAQLTTLSGPGGGLLATYSYDGSGSLATVTYTDSPATGYKFAYDASGLLLTVKDLTDRVLETHTYVTGTGKGLTSEISDGKEKLTLAYDLNRAKTTVTDANGNSTQYSFTEIYGTSHVTKLVGACQGCGAGSGQEVQEWTYDDKGHVQTHKDGNGHVTEYAYNGDGDLVSMTEAAGTPFARTTQYTNYDSTGLRATRTVPSVVNPTNNKVTSYDYTNGELHTLTETGLLGNGTPYSYVTTNTYTAGRLTSVDGPRTDVSDVTTITYDAVTGDLTSTTVPLAGTTTYSDFTALGQAQTVTDPNDVATTYTYDTRRRILTSTIDGATTIYHYSPSGKLLAVDRPRGNTVHYDYDAYDRLEKTRDHYGNYLKYTYDDMSRRTKEEIFDTGNVLQKTLSFEYDTFNRLKRTVNSDAAATFTEYGYDQGGNRTSVKNPRGFTTTYDYDALNRLVDVAQPGTLVTTSGYNLHDGLTSVTDVEGHVTEYRYDDMGRVHQETSPDSGTTSYTYDAAGNRTSKTDARGVAVNFTYDALNRLTLAQFPTAPAVTYTYDNASTPNCANGKGRLCRIVKATAATTTYSYSPRGQLLQETKQFPLASFVTGYGYDANDNLVTVTYPSGRVATYGFDLADRITSVTTTPPGGSPQTLASGILYKPYGGIRQLNYGSGLVRNIGYDTQYWVSSIQTGSIQNLTYTPDANGNFTAITNLVNPGANKTFGYDALDRLLTASGPWGNLAWTYDGVGNRRTYTAAQEGMHTYTYEPGTNRLSSVSGRPSTTFGYDNSGNNTSQNGWTYAYDEEGRMTQATSASELVGYGYYGNGQRASKAAGTFFTVTTLYHYDQSGLLLAETSDGGVQGSEYVWLEGQPLAKLEGGAISYIHPDHLNTPMLMSNTGGTKVWEIESRPFGDGATITGTASLNLRFPGQYLDVETAVNQNWFRDYDPKIGRYVETDPIFSASSNYSYVQNNPERLTDPKGLLTIFGPCSISEVMGCRTYCGARGQRSTRCSLWYTPGATIVFCGCEDDATGDCSPTEFARLANTVDYLCKVVRRRCAGNCCDDLIKQWSTVLACRAARETLNRRCFKGKKHSNDEDEWLNADKRCQRLLRKNSCL